MVQKSAVIITHAAKLRHQRVLELLSNMKVLPSTIRVPLRLLELQRSATSTAADFGNALLADPSLASRTIALANSSYFSPSRPVNTVTEAVKMIGTSNLMPLLFSVALAGMFHQLELSKELRDALWRSAVLKAVTAQQCALLLKSDHREEAFLCGLLQDVGLPAMYASDPSATATLSALLDLSQADADSRQKAMYGATHAQFGATYARNMKLPELFERAISMHHAPVPGDLGESYADLRLPVQLAGVLPHRPSANDSVLRERFQRVLSLYPDARLDAARLAPAVVKQYAATTRALGMDDDLKFRDFLQEVCVQIADTMANAIGASAQAIGRLEQEVQSLQGQAAKADFDALTGTLNRRGLMDRGSKLLDLMRANRMRCAIGYADLDEFKLINDSFGHDVGDMALAHLAGALRRSLKGKGVVARLGGDEFVFLVAVRDATEQAEITALLRESTARVHIPDAPAAPVTASVGILWMGTPSADETIESALARADKLMYEVKKEGRGELRVLEELPQAA
jgi:diguanylate cyclase (GGDEF)-like protein